MPFAQQQLVLVVLLIIVGQVASGSGLLMASLGALVPQAKGEGSDYYEQFHLDYGTKDNKRFAGSLRGFITSGKLAGLPESDPFFKWLNEHLEKGPEPVSGRLKPFYAADFGTKKDLKKGENPKVMIVQRKLTYDKNGILDANPARQREVDVEVREIWQPWLKHKCDFVARYIVPSRVNICKILESEGRFLSELEFDQDENGKRVAWAKMTFKPTLRQRLAGSRDVVLRRPLDANKLPLASSVKAFGMGRASSPSKVASE